MANQTIPGLNTITAPSSAGLLWVSDPNASPQDRSLTLANLGKLPFFLSYLIGQSGKALSSTPYTLAIPFEKSVFFVTTGASAFVFNLPSAVSALANGPVTIIKADSGAGVIQIAPNGSDVIDKAGNVSCYLGAQWQSLTLEATASGEWTVLGGAFMPHQTVDTDGQQYNLGKPKGLPLDATNRVIVNGAAMNVGGWFGPIAVAGSYGVPLGAKALIARINQGGTATIGFSNNNSVVPSSTTAHPLIALTSYHNGVVIPLNAAGAFYYNIIGTSAGGLYVVAQGFSMGD